MLSLHASLVSLLLFSMSWKRGAMFFCAIQKQRSDFTACSTQSRHPTVLRARAWVHPSERASDIITLEGGAASCCNSCAPASSSHKNSPKYFYRDEHTRHSNAQHALPPPDDDDNCRVLGQDIGTCQPRESIRRSLKNRRHCLRHWHPFSMPILTRSGCVDVLCFYYQSNKGSIGAIILRF